MGSEPPYNIDQDIHNADWPKRSAWDHLDNTNVLYWISKAPYEEVLNFSRLPAMHAAPIEVLNAIEDRIDAGPGDASSLAGAPLPSPS